MSVGKYSPTVTEAYSRDQEWWNRNGGENPANVGKPWDIFGYDVDGYDSYGYDKDDIDRAGVHEGDYMESAWDENENIFYPKYESVLYDWGINDDGFPVEIKRPLKRKTDVETILKRWTTADEIRLRAGEIDPDTMRDIIAVTNAMAREIREALKEKEND